MKVTVRTSLLDMVAFVLHLKKRNGKFRRASSASKETGKLNRLSSCIHPPVQKFRIISRKEESPTAATFRMTPVEPDKKIAVFRAGQYVSVEADIDGIVVSRPFSIASPPDESNRENFYDITVRTKDDGFLAPWIMKNWETGTIVQTSDPQGYFHYESLRDSDTLVCLAGGSGIAPFRSMIPDLLQHEAEVSIVLFYGATSPDEILFHEDWLQMVSKYPQRFRFIPVCSEEAGDWPGETGFLTVNLIGRYLSTPQDASFFICGPSAMLAFLDTELGEFELKSRQVRREHFGDASQRKSFPDSLQISVQVEGSDTVLEIPADPAETVLVALERAGLNPPALCRSGHCGWCRSHLVNGAIHVPEDSDGRRAADRKFGYFHPCSSWPESNLAIRIPRNPKHY